MAFTSPVAMPSNSCLSARTTQSAAPPSRDTETSPLASATRQMSICESLTSSKRTLPTASPSNGS